MLGICPTIVQKLVLLPGGKTEGKSTPSKGSCSNVYFDLEKGRDFDEISEELFNLLVAKKLLLKAGCNVTNAQNGKIDVGTFGRPPVRTFDAIPMNIHMPAMSCLEAAKKKCMIDVEIPIIALSANDSDIDEEKFAEGRMNAPLSTHIEPWIMYETLLKYVAFDG